LIDNATVGVDGRWIRGNLSQLVGLGVKEILPCMNPLVSTRRTPFYEEELLRLRVVAGCLVTLVCKLLDMLDGRFRSNDVEESFVKSNEIS
jgi:hypothetical protein